MLRNRNGSLKISKRALIDLGSEVLKSGGVFCTQVKGRCMHPVVRDRDFVFVKSIPLAQVRIGDIVVYRIFEDGMHIYQVYQRPKTKDPRAFLGKVIAIERNGRRIITEGRLAHWRNFFWLFFTLCNILICKLKRRDIDG